MTCPSSCRAYQCNLSYAAHLRTIAFTSEALPTRSTSQPVIDTNIREKRWDRDHAAFRRLVKDGYLPPQLDGSRFRERVAENEYDINARKVTVDYSDPT